MFKWKKWESNLDLELWDTPPYPPLESRPWLEVSARSDFVYNFVVLKVSKMEATMSSNFWNCKFYPYIIQTISAFLISTDSTPYSAAQYERVDMCKTEILKCSEENKSPNSSTTLGSVFIQEEHESHSKKTLQVSDFRNSSAPCGECLLQVSTRQKMEKNTIGLF